MSEHPTTLPALPGEGATVNEWAKHVAAYRETKGFETSWDNVVEKLCLCHSELSEALEEIRAGRLAEYFEASGKPAGFWVEIADLLIRVFDLAGSLGCDLDRVLRLKQAYNLTRPPKHGKRL